MKNINGYFRWHYSVLDVSRSFIPVVERENGEYSGSVPLGNGNSSLIRGVAPSEGYIKYKLKYTEFVL